MTRQRPHARAIGTGQSGQQGVLTLFIGTVRAVVSDQAPSEPIPCSPCRGTGEVISNLGGTPTEQPCPWCEGTGIFIADHDAQARFKDEPAPSEPAA